jgi:hypothetical protein
MYIQRSNIIHREEIYRVLIDDISGMDDSELKMVCLRYLKSAIGKDVFILPLDVRWVDDRQAEVFVKVSTGDKKYWQGER